MSVVTVPLVCQAHDLPLPTAEYRFSRRRYRFDYAWLPDRVALEVNGGVWTQGRHTRGPGYLRDMEKLNLAQLDGWVVLQCSPQDVQSGKVAALLRQALA